MEEKTDDGKVSFEEFAKLFGVCERAVACHFNAIMDYLRSISRMHDKNAEAKRGTHKRRLQRLNGGPYRTRPPTKLQITPIFAASTR